jgi:hypothetical protein
MMAKMVELGKVASCLKKLKRRGKRKKTKEASEVVK